MLSRRRSSSKKRKKFFTLPDNFYSHFILSNFNRDCSSSRENFQRFTATQRNIKVSSRLIEMSRIKIQFAIKFKESIFYKKMLQLLQLLLPPLSEHWNHFRSRLCFACLWKKKQLRELQVFYLLSLNII